MLTWFTLALTLRFLSLDSRMTWHPSSFSCRQQFKILSSGQMISMRCRQSSMALWPNEHNRERDIRLLNSELHFKLGFPRNYPWIAYCLPSYFHKCGESPAMPFVKSCRSPCFSTYPIPAGPCTGSLCCNLILEKTGKWSRAIEESENRKWNRRETRTFFQNIFDANQRAEENVCIGYDKHLASLVGWWEDFGTWVVNAWLGGCIQEHWWFPFHFFGFVNRFDFLLFDDCYK